MATNKCKPLPPMSAADVQRFHKYVNASPGQGPKGDCWEWIGGLSSKGYARFSIPANGKWVNVSASRVAMLLNTGKDPYPLFACHSCDNPPCVRGEHLFAGTPRDNLEDCARKDRTSHGEVHPKAKLTEEIVREVHLRLSSGETQANIARSLGVNQTAISFIHRRVHWARVR
jgi:hypothetical protein